MMDLFKIEQFAMLILKNDITFQYYNLPRRCGKDHIILKAIELFYSDEGNKHKKINVYCKNNDCVEYFKKLIEDTNIVIYDVHVLNAAMQYTCGDYMDICFLNDCDFISNKNLYYAFAPGSARLIIIETLE
ncbi:MAG: hypothetical protein WC783_04325 [Candidatus Paceibacterota bacterium]|jgi:hypothetical protein